MYVESVDLSIAWADVADLNSLFPSVLCDMRLQALGDVLMHINPILVLLVPNFFVAGGTT